MPRILIADDNAYMRKAMARLLEKRGHRVDTATNGREAATKIMHREKLQQPYDILVTDIMMPDIDGFKLVEMIRKKSKPIGIIAITGGTKTVNPNDALEILKPHIDESLVKPFRHQDFIIAVETAVKRQWRRIAGEL